MRTRRIIKHVLEVAISNIAIIVAGIVVGFVVPKIISVESYGYLKSFTLYVTYLGLFSLGIADGIVLDYGGVDYEKLERPLFRSYFKWYLILHIVFAVLLSSVALIVQDGNGRFICIALSINLLAVNISGYFQNISQITQRFKEYSIRRVLQSICNIAIVGAMYVAYRYNYFIDYRYYVVPLLIVNSILTLWYLYTYRDIVFGVSFPIISQKKKVLHLIRTGFPLLFANLCSTFILTLDRQFVNVLFDTETYAVYAFAYSMLALITVATSAIATVLYPTLKRTTTDAMKRTYPLLVTILMVFVFGVQVLYFPLKWIVIFLLPQYSDSLIIFRIIFPGLGISSIITVIIHNYYKALGMNMVYFKKSILVIAISAVANLLAYFIFRTTVSISVASIISMLIWYFYLDHYFKKKYKYRWVKLFIYLISMMVLFYVSASFKNDVIGILLYLVLFILVSYLFFRKDVSAIGQLISSKKGE